MATVNKVRNIAPFINYNFVVTSPWWSERTTGTSTVIHRGLDIATSIPQPVYSILNGIVHSKGYDDSQGNWIVIKDNDPNSSTYGYATLYMHLQSASILPINANVNKGTYVGMEGTTGQSTGVHLHVEMQDLNRFNNRWHWSYVKSDYIDPTSYMGINNIKNTWWIYDGTPQPQPTPSGNIKRNKFPWVLYSRKLRNKRY